jgi:hypothetical protein
MRLLDELEVVKEAEKVSRLEDRNAEKMRRDSLRVAAPIDPWRAKTPVRQAIGYNRGMSQRCFKGRTIQNPVVIKVTNDRLLASHLYKVILYIIMKHIKSVMYFLLHRQPLDSYLSVR